MRKGSLVFLVSLAVLGVACSDGEPAVDAPPSAPPQPPAAAAVEPVAAPAPVAPDAGAPQSAAARWRAFASSKGAASGDVVIGIRGRTVKGVRHETRVRREFDDTLVIVVGEEVTVVPVSTHPFERTSTSVPDVTGDGKRDVAMIRPGNYRAVLRTPDRNIGGAPTYHILTTGGSEHIPAWRNTNQDDAYSDAEKQASESRGDTASAILFHQAATTPPAQGCQVLEPGMAQRFASLVGDKVNYLLVDAADDVPAT